MWNPGTQKWLWSQGQCLLLARALCASGMRSGAAASPSGKWVDTCASSGPGSIRAMLIFAASPSPVHLAPWACGGGALQAQGCRPDSLNPWHKPGCGWGKEVFQSVMGCTLLNLSVTQFSHDEMRLKQCLPLTFEEVGSKQLNRCESVSSKAPGERAPVQRGAWCHQEKVNFPKCTLEATLVKSVTLFTWKFVWPEARLIFSLLPKGKSDDA